jgi:hypothetical protein
MSSTLFSVNFTAFEIEKCDAMRTSSNLYIQQLTIISRKLSTALVSDNKGTFSVYVTTLTGNGSSADWQCARVFALTCKHRTISQLHSRTSTGLRRVKTVLQTWPAGAVGDIWYMGIVCRSPDGPFPASGRKVNEAPTWTYRSTCI